MNARAAAFLAAVLALTPGAARSGPWDDYQLIMWQDHDAVRMAGLARLGFSGVKLRGTGGSIGAADLAARREARMPFYIENIATDFYAPYHRWTDGKPVTWLFDAARARRAEAPGDGQVFVRDPGLSDPAWIARVQSRLDQVVRRHAADRPLFYNLGDETGIADLSAHWDFDIAPASLAGMRTWLRTQYADLDALNRQWGTGFTAWDAVVPELTDAAMARTDDNFSAWADFKAWMDVSFAAALRAGTEAVHGADPTALSAIEGAQVPGWGGYDYGLLAGAVDVMDIYDSGNNLEIARSLHPALIPLLTGFESGPRATHGAWQNLLRGGRGQIIWDERDDVVTAAGEPGPRGRALSTLIDRLRAVAPALIASPPAPSPVAMLYSQASFRTRWILDHRPRGPGWSDRDAERELDDNPWRASRRQMAARLVQIGLPPRWLSSQGVEAGALQDGSVRVLMLPHVIALSAGEVAAIRQFAQRGGTVLADTEPGLFDQHSRRRPSSPLAGVARMPQVVRPDADPASAATLTALAALLADAGAVPDIVPTGPDGLRASNVDARVFRNGAVRIVALQAAAPWGAPPRLELQLREGGYVQDLRAPGPLRQTDRLDVALDPLEPAVFAVSPTLLPSPLLSGPGAALPGAPSTWQLRLDGPTPAAVHPMRLDVLDASGGVVRPLSAVVRVGPGGASWSVALPAGDWRVRATDTLTGRAAVQPIGIAP